MKVRNGFVSNSSSSSFILFGNPIEPKDIQFEDIKKERICVHGGYLGEGDDLFVLTPEIFKVIEKDQDNPKLEDFYYYFTYFLIEDGEAMDLRTVPLDCRVYSIEVDYHSSDTLEKFKQNYSLPD